MEYEYYTIILIEEHPHTTYKIYIVIIQKRQYLIKEARTPSHRDEATKKQAQLKDLY